jgi:OOP family OmpA-OmpF porin
MARLCPVRGSLLAALLSLTGVAHGEPLPSINLRGFAPPPGPKGMLYLESVNTPGHLQFNTAGWLSWAYRPLVVRRNDQIASSIVKHQAALDLAGAVGIGKRLELGLVLPVLLAQTGDSTPETSQALGGSKVPSQALGDATLAMKATLRPVDEEFGGLGLALVGRVGLPTGDRASTLGEGAVTSEVRALVEMRVLAASLQATTGFKVRTEERTFGGKTWGDEIPWGFGFWIKPQMLGLDRGGRWRLGVESHGTLPAGPDAPFTSKAQAPAFLAGSARYMIRDLQLLGGLEGGISQGAGAAPLRVIFGANWAPRNHDLDGDGIEDEVDDCKNKPEDRDGFEDRDGCPDPDNDDDDVVDEDDKCPLEAEDPDDFEDEDGCPDPDNDRDGILDGDDGCPNDVGPRSTDPEKNGCPVLDPDNDGVEGEDDKCPEQPEDLDDFEDEDGCPDPDNDKDGIADDDDACPDDTGEPSAMPKQNGCPSPDRDRDAILNDFDKCPDEPETYNGFEDDDGCPDTPKGKPISLVNVVERRGKKEISLGAPLRFKKGSTDLEPRSVAVARALARQLVLSPDLRLTLAVRPSPADGGDDLAQRRAETLVALLIQGSRRPDGASVGAWTRGKMPPDAEVKGIALFISQGKTP